MNEQPRGTLQATESSIFPVVETAEGRVRGYVSGGISVFKGLRYGADTSGANRFLPPKPVTPWAGVRDALNYANISPQMPTDRRRGFADLNFGDVQPGGMGEDCLAVNVWTPEASHQSKRPVLFRIHGSGFYASSGNSVNIDGEMLARFGDCVVVTVTHRLNALGYLYLGDDGDHADSGASGMADIVAALAWVKRNIAAFGGDPDRVLIFGQSGGGSKVSHLLSMPSAKGLFQRAGVASGSRLLAVTREAAEKVTHQFVARLGLTIKDIGRLREVPFTQLVAAQAEIEASAPPGEASRSFAPVMGRLIPRHPFTPDAPPTSSDVPMIVSTALDERSYRETKFDMSFDDVTNRLREHVGDKAGDVLSMYRDDDPKATPYLLFCRYRADIEHRRNAGAMADRKAAQTAAGGAPVWMYLWSEPSPAFAGRYGATHSIDNSHSMHDVRLALAGSQANGLRLADEIASAWVSFAASGDPNNPKTPDWPEYEPTKRMTMVFGTPSGAQADPRRGFREYWDRFYRQ